MVGAAWVDGRGWFTVKLNSHVVLSEVQLRGGYLNLYPNGPEKRDEPPPEVPPALTGWESEV